MNLSHSVINSNTINTNSSFKQCYENDVITFNKAVTITVVLVGGGGAGGKSSHSTIDSCGNCLGGLHGGGGGGGGDMIVFTYDVQPNVGYPLIVGRGGVAPSGIGENTTFLGYTAKGGKGGGNANLNGPGKAGAGINGGDGGLGMYANQTVLVPVNYPGGISPYNTTVEPGHLNPYSSNSSNFGIGGSGGTSVIYTGTPPTQGASPIQGSGNGGSGGNASEVKPSLSGAKVPSGNINISTNVSNFTAWGQNGSSGAAYIYL